MSTCSCFNRPLKQETQLELSFLANHYPYVIRLMSEYFLLIVIHIRPKPHGQLGTLCDNHVSTSTEPFFNHAEIFAFVGCTLGNHGFHGSQTTGYSIMMFPTVSVSTCNGPFTIVAINQLLPHDTHDMV